MIICQIALQAQREESGVQVVMRIRCQLDILAKEREMLEKRDCRDDERHAKKMAVINREARKDKPLAKNIAKHYAKSIWLFTRPRLETSDKICCPPPPLVLLIHSPSSDVLL